ncbi:MAG: FtsB family cell division protein [Bacteroidota bacterium]
MHIVWKQLLQWLKKPYFALGLGALVWMFFFDSEDLITQYRLRRKLGRLEAEKAYYLEQIAKLQQAREELASNEDSLEKFAREKYFMKRAKEDLYVIVDE